MKKENQEKNNQNPSPIIIEFNLDKLPLEEKRRFIRFLEAVPQGNSAWNPKDGDELPSPGSIVHKIARANRNMKTFRSKVEELCGALSDMEKRETEKVRAQDDPNFKLHMSTSDSGLDGTLMELSMDMGEIVYHVRTALDHLVRMLVLVSGGTPSLSCGFPIFNNYVSIDDFYKKKALDGLADAFKIRLYYFQPFLREDEIMTEFAHLRYVDSIDRSVLQKLNYICNVDKHRHLLLQNRRSKRDDMGILRISPDPAIEVGIEFEKGKVEVVEMISFLEKAILDVKEIVSQYVKGSGEEREVNFDF